MRPAKVAKLANEIGLGFIHCFYECLNSSTSVMHYILMNIRNKAKPQDNGNLARTKDKGLAETGTGTGRNGL